MQTNLAFWDRGVCMYVCMFAVVAVVAVGVLCFVTLFLGVDALGHFVVLVRSRPRTHARHR